MAGDFQIVVDEGVKKLLGKPKEIRELRKEICKKMLELRFIVSKKSYSCERCGVKNIILAKWNNDLDQNDYPIACPKGGCIDIKLHNVYS